MLSNPVLATKSTTLHKRPNHRNSCRISFTVLFSVLAGTFVLAQSDEDSFRQRRDEMVRTQIAASRWGGAEAVRDARVLEAFREVPRHRFAPAELAPHAYEDRPLPIGYGQTISQPYIVAKMTELVEPKKDYRALEIGTGAGYQAAILSRLVAEVYTIEIVEPLGAAARKRLADLGYRNVDVRIEDGYYGWPEKAPFDCIVVTAAANHIPPPLIDNSMSFRRTLRTPRRRRRTCCFRQSHRFLRKRSPDVSRYSKRSHPPSTRPPSRLCSAL